MPAVIGKLCALAELQFTSENKLMFFNTGHFCRAVIYLLLAILLFDLQAVTIKILGDRYPVQELASFRNVFGLIPSLLVLMEYHLADGYSINTN